MRKSFGSTVGALQSRACKSSVKERLLQPSFFHSYSGVYILYNSTSSHTPALCTWHNTWPSPTIFRSHVKTRGMYDTHEGEVIAVKDCILLVLGMMIVFVNGRFTVLAVGTNPSFVAELQDATLFGVTRQLRRRFPSILHSFYTHCKSLWCKSVYCIPWKRETDGKVDSAKVLLCDYSSGNYKYSSW